MGSEIQPDCTLLPHMPDANLGQLNQAVNAGTPGSKERLQAVMDLADQQLFTGLGLAIAASQCRTCENPRTDCALGAAVIEPVNRVVEVGLRTSRKWNGPWGSS